MRSEESTLVLLCSFCFTYVRSIYEVFAGLYTPRGVQQQHTVVCHTPSVTVCTGHTRPRDVGRVQLHVGPLCLSIAKHVCHGAATVPLERRWRHATQHGTVRISRVCSKHTCAGPTACRAGTRRCACHGAECARASGSRWLRLRIARSQRPRPRHRARPGREHPAGYRPAEQSRRARPQSTLTAEKIFHTNHQAAKKPIVPVISVNEIEAIAMYPK
jgi:hypothetical protein